MSVDLKRIKDMATQASDIISKGRQIMSAANETVAKLHDAGVVKSKDCEIKELEEKKAEVVKSHEAVAPESQSSGKNALPVAVEMLNTPAAVVKAISVIAEQANETIRFCEEQETVRTGIKAKAAVEITRINAMADMVRDYLHRSFDGRAAIFDNYFSVLDKALERGDDTLVVHTLQSINSLAVSSPFKDLLDLGKVSEDLINGEDLDI